MILYGLKQCDTCRKALKELKNVTFVDVRAEGVPAAILERAHAEFGENLLNRRSTTWRNLSDEARLEPALTLLKAHPTLMKRPLIEDNGRLTLGWNDDVRAMLLG